MVPSRDEIEEYLGALDEWVSSSLHAATSDIPSLNAIANRIWADLGRFGPPHIQVPSLGIFDVPPPPPPPLPELTWLEKTGDWILNHRWKALTLGICVVVGSGLLVGYASAKVRRAKVRSRRKKEGVRPADRKQVVVVLGADCVIGPPLIAELESNGLIVIATVASQEALDRLESQFNGFVRLFLLDPAEGSAAKEFVKVLQSTLSVRFPNSAAGDPYHSSPSHHPHIQSVISLLSLHSPPPPSPFESISLATGYLRYLHISHLTPLAVIQGILPLMRVASNTRASKKNRIVVCVPVIASRVGVAWNAAEAMSTGATLKGLDVLRRELRESHQAQHTIVTVVDMGAVGFPSALNSEVVHSAGEAAYMNEWSSNLRATYGTAFLAALEQSRISPRQPEHIVKAVRKLSGLADGENSGNLLANFDWYNWERVAIGAGAYSYTVASALPRWILDSILSLPSLLIQLRNAFLTSPGVVVVPEKVLDDDDEEEEEEEEEEDEEDHEDNIDVRDHEDKTLTASQQIAPLSSASSSEIDLDSLNSSDRENIGSSWISLSSSKADEGV